MPLTSRFAQLVLPGKHAVDDKLCSISVPTALRCVVLVPAQQFSTDEARRLLQPTVSRTVAVFNASRSALLVHAFTDGNLEDLAEATQDLMHQVSHAT